MLTCDDCGGKNWEGGLTVSKGRALADMRDEARSTGKIFAICRHCKKHSNLRVIPLASRSKPLPSLPPVPPEAHAFHLNPRPAHARRG